MDSADEVPVPGGASNVGFGEPLEPVQMVFSETEVEEEKESGAIPSAAAPVQEKEVMQGMDPGKDEEKQEISDSETVLDQGVDKYGNLKGFISYEVSREPPMSDTVRKFFESQEGETGFNLLTYSHVLPEGATQDFEDYDSEDLEDEPELGLEDEEVLEGARRMSYEDRVIFHQIRDFCEIHYRKYGYIQPPGAWVAMTMYNRFPRRKFDPEQDKERLDLFRKCKKREEARQQGKLVPRRLNKGTAVDEVGIEVLQPTDPSKPTIVEVRPNVNLYGDIKLDQERDAILIGDSSEGESVIGDDLSEFMDDLSICTTDSLTKVDPEKVENIFRRFSEIRKQEAELYTQLADMVPGMAPETLHDSVQRIPPPQQKLPDACYTLVQECETEGQLKQIICAGIMQYDKFRKETERRKGKKYKQRTYAYLNRVYGTDVTRLAEIRRGAAYSSEEAKAHWRLKKEQQLQPDEQEMYEPADEQRTAKKRRLKPVKVSSLRGSKGKGRSAASLSGLEMEDQTQDVVQADPQTSGEAPLQPE